VTAILTTIAMLSLSLFQGLESELREKISSHGLDNLFLVETVSGDDAARVLAVEPDETEYLASLGTVQRLKTVGAAARTLGNEKVITCCYDKTLIPEIAPQLGEDDWAAFVSPESPVGLPIRYRISIDGQNLYGSARNIRLDGIRDAMQTRSDLLLLPVEVAKPYLTRGFASYTRVKLSAPEDATTVISALKAYYAVEERSVRIVDSASLMSELQSLVERQQLLRLAIVAMLSAISFLVLGTIAVLELKTNVRVFALIASFGISRHAVFVAFLIENVLLVNAAAVFGIYVACVSEQHLTGFVGSMIPFQSGSFYERLLSEGAWFIYLAVNAGAIASAVLVRLGLRKDVGRLLS
jgi:hypothetical protein